MNIANQEELKLMLDFGLIETVTRVVETFHWGYYNIQILLSAHRKSPLKGAQFWKDCIVTDDPWIIGLIVS